MILESDSHELLCELYSLYLEQLRKMGDYLSSISPPYDFESIQQLAHKMKSSSQSVGALRVAELLNETETAAFGCNNLQMQNVIEVLLQDCISTIGVLETELMTLNEWIADSRLTHDGVTPRADE